jgi:hypothetical protein
MFRHPTRAIIRSLYSCYYNAFEWSVLQWVYEFTVNSQSIHSTTFVQLIIRNRYDNHHKHCVMMVLWCAETCWRIRIILTKMHYFLLIYFNNKSLCVSSRLAAHHEENQLCIDSNWYSHSKQSTQRMTIPIAVYTELILLMMGIKPSRNM